MQHSGGLGWDRFGSQKHGSGRRGLGLGAFSRLVTMDGIGAWCSLLVVLVEVWLVLLLKLEV